MTTHILEVGGVTLNSCVMLHTMIRSFHSQKREARALKSELSDLTSVLESLLETVAQNPTLDFGALEIPLQRCGQACEEYGKLVERCTKHSSDNSRRSVRDWLSQTYLQGDIDDFRAMLASHKATINIALANANLRNVILKPGVLEDYKELISDTTNDLQLHMVDIEAKIERLREGDPETIKMLAIEWNAMLEEKKTTQYGLDMCTKLSMQISQYESSSSESTQFSSRPSAHKHVKSGLGHVKRSIGSLIDNLRVHEASINAQLETMSLTEAASEPVAAQLAQLRQTKESINKCIEIVSEAGEQADRQSNLFEDITLTENSYAFSVSTVNDLVIARRLNLQGRSRHFGGQMDDQTVQKSIAALTKLDEEWQRNLSQTQVGQDSSTASQQTTDDNKFGRYGPGKSVATNRAI